ncbi:Rgg family transcriptional regulator [Lapidilactobacillus luobeiensis]|uniref:Rgg family transcriptional regulator n=1 Tax=Lapidilactobacillus luobeiensis TaxID=2950371 RepID=UPI0021C2E08D|nr:helix-turn-helix domain-containing protein [Lapidilactobacillus luobeiensis]
MEHAELFAKLRKERGISQEKLAQGISSRSAIAVFENRHTKLSLEYAISYLERMNITLDEYMYLFNENHLSEKRQLTKQLFSKNPQESAQAEKLIQQKFQETGDLYFEYQLLEIDLAELPRHQLPIEIDHLNELAPKIKKITQHLDRVETWGRFELSMFANCCYLFETEHLISSLNSAIAKMLDYQEKNYTSRYLGILLRNCLRLALERDSDDLLQVTLNHLDSIQPNQDDLITCVLSRFFKRITVLPPAEYQSDSEIRQLLSILALFEINSWKNLLKNYYNIEDVVAD